MISNHLCPEQEVRVKKEARAITVRQGKKKKKKAKLIGKEETKLPIFR